MDMIHYSAPTCVSHNGFLFKTASMARAITERKAREGNLLTLTYNKVGILCLVNLHLCPPCRVQSSLVYSEWRHLQLLWEWQELKPQRSSESFRDCLLGCRTAWETWVHAYKPKNDKWCSLSSSDYLPHNILSNPQVWPYLWTLLRVWASLSVWHWWPRQPQGMGQVYCQGNH